jgi:tetratricopeptide (TPR) repeat protein
MRIVIIAIILTTCFSGHAQINFSRYLQEAFIPGVDPEEYTDVVFQWNMPGKTQTFMNEGLTELKENNYTTAAENFKEVIKLNPDFWPAHFYLGVCNKAMRQWDETEKNLTQSLKLSPQWQTHHQLGDYYHIKKAYTKASDHYEKAIELNPGAVLPTYQLGNVAFVQMNARKALKYYEKCNEVDPAFALAYVMEGLLKLKADRKNKESLAYFNKALEANENCKEALFWRGFLFLALNEPNKTLADWGKLVDSNPDVPFFRYMRAFLAIEVEDYDLAFNDLRKAIASIEDDPDAFRGGQTLMDKRIDIQYATNYAMRYAYGLSPESLGFFKKGFCLFLSDKHRSALNEFKKAEKLEVSPAIYFLKALSYEHIEEFDSANIYYDKALKIDNDIFDAHKKRGLYRFSKKDYRGAYADFADMIRIQPQLLISYRLRGLVKFEQGDFTGAMIDFTKYINGDSTDHDILAKRGVSFTHLQNYPNAVKDFKKAIELEPKQDSYYEWLSQSYMHAHDTISALNTLDENLKIFPNQITSYTRRAEFYMMQKRWVDAVKDTELAMTKLPNGYDNHETLSDLFFLKGLILFRSGNFTSSVESFTRSLKEDKHNDQSKYYRAKAYLQLGMKKDARQDLKELSSKSYLDARQLYESLK